MLDGYRCVDLTQTIDADIPTWSGNCGFGSTAILDYPQGARVLEYQMIASAGTHIDAPSHFIPNGRDVDSLTLEELCVEICVVDLTTKLHREAQITLQDFEKYEAQYGKIPKGSVVIGNTGWSRYWNVTEEYRGLEQYPIMPSMHPSVGDLLLKREVVGIGIDTLSPDPYDGGYPLHVQLLGANKYILENLTNLDQLPKKGAYLLALPLKIRGGTESPVRAIALIPTK